MNPLEKFDYAEVENYCTELYNLLDEFKIIGEDFNQSIKKIKNGSIWKGKASDGFVKKTEKTVTLYSNMEEQFKNFILFIISCSENYSHSESLIMERIKENLSQGG